MNYLDTITRMNLHEKYLLTSKQIPDFISFLKTQGAVYAAQKKGEQSYSYQYVEDPANVVLDYPRTIQPLKKFFLPPREELLSFDYQNNSYQKTDVVAEKRIFFGIHSYEMQGVLRLDYSFKKGNPEGNYLNRRENCIFIGVSYEPDEFHLANALGIEVENTEGLSIYLEPVREGYIAFVIDEAGQNLIQGFGKTAKVTETIHIKEKPAKAKIRYHYNRLPKVFEHVYTSQVWGQIAKKCLGCGTCNLLCSTCYCFDVRDEVSLDLQSGTRERFWDGCMLNRFAEVAGNENFRDELSSRTRHRLHRKFKYLTEESGALHCVGCGRCSKYCPAKINLGTTINALIDDFTEQQKLKEAY